ncbi:hypothetical protein AX15_000507 [Amanita polypyramis BW_CC]|nr:hypothetical protein AX15_000507 [Amanita polypyramis BW_CC]
MTFFNFLRNRTPHDNTDNTSAPPAWSAAPEPIHAFGMFSDVPEGEYEAGEEYCARYPVALAKLLPSNVAERIHTIGSRAWGMQVPNVPRFRGTISKTGSGTTLIHTEKECRDTSVLSDLPILGGLYDIPGDMDGVYFEIEVKRMDEIVAIGTACRPYPGFRFPGWNRLSAGFHLDDMRKFFEDPDGGRDYVTARVVRSGDVVGCGYEFRRGVVFFTYNGERLPDAFTGVYLPRGKYDVYGAIGVVGRSEIEVNFGADIFRWKEGNGERWRIDRHVGGTEEGALPAYSLT